MGNKLKTQALMQSQSAASLKTILIMSANSDDAFHYHAQVADEIHPLVFVVYFHDGSRLLEKVRLFGSVDVYGNFPGHGEFLGNLCLHAGPLKNCPDRRVALELKVLRFQ